MRKLTNGTNIIAPDADYLKGRVKDESTPGVSNDGTVLNETIFGDIFEMIHKLVSAAGITENELPDNETNGHQIIEALEAKIISTSSGSVSFFPDPTLLNGWAENAGGIGYYKDKLGNQFIVIDSLDGTSATSDVICNLSDVSTGGRRRFFMGATDAFAPIAFEIDATGNLKTNSRADFICCAYRIPPQ